MAIAYKGGDYSPTAQNEAIPRPSFASVGDLAVVTALHESAVSGWTRVAPTGGAGSVYWRKYDGSGSDTFPSVAYNTNEIANRLLTVWSGAGGVEDVTRSALNHGYSYSPGGTTVLPSRTATRRGAVYVWQATDGWPSLGYIGRQNPVSPLTARFTGTNLSQVFGTSLRRMFYAASVSLTEIGASGTFTQRLISEGSGGSTGEDYTFVLVPDNLPPNAPTPLAPANNEAVSKDELNRFSHQANDPNPGDSQSKSNLRYRVAGASSWTTVANVSPNAFVDIPAGTFSAAQYEWQVQTFDAEGLEGPWSSSSFFTAGTRPAGPSITSLVNGQTINDTPVLVEWVGTGGASHYQVRRVADAAGVVDTANVLFTSAELLASAGQAYALALPTNSQYEHVQVREKVAGLWSDWAAASKRILVSYTLPATALLSVAPVQTVVSTYVFTDANAVTIVNPAPTGGQPQVAYRNVWCKALTDGDLYRPKDVPVRIATLQPSGTFTDRAVASDVDYAYAIEQIATNGTASMSDYVGDVRDLSVVVTPGGGGDFDDTDFATADFD